MKKRILLTGAGGRLGSFLREPLSKICTELVSTDIKKILESSIKMKSIFQLI